MEVSVGSIISLSKVLVGEMGERKSLQRSGRNVVEGEGTEVR